MAFFTGSETPRELVAAAIGTPLLFQYAGQRLEKLPLDDAAVSLLLEEHRAGRVPPFLVAYLIGCMGYSAGYAIVKDIATSADSQAGGHAGATMVKLRGDDARSDLEAILVEGTTTYAREGAAYALLQLGGPTVTARVIDAINLGLLDPKMAGTLRTQDIEDSFVLAWLDSDQAHKRQAAFYLVRDRLRLHDAAQRVSVRLATAVKEAIEQGRVPARPRSHHLFNEYLAKRDST